MINWPEKKESTYQKDWDQEKSVFNKGYNTAIDDCKKAVEESTKLVELDQVFERMEYILYTNKTISGSIPSDKSRLEMIEHIIKDVRSKFGTPKPRTVVTVEDIEQIIQSEGHKNSGKPWIEERYAIAQAIVKRLEEGK